ncbi:MAG: esterase, partial [Kribbellaceae bacterium]|nr:esterase [Kribbellaceae bacterium]
MSTDNLVTETFSYDGGRQVAVHVPSSPPEAVVYAGVALPPERTAVCGVSASAELALALGMRHPDVYGSVFAASPGGGYQPPATMPERLPRAYLVAGTEEPWFMENTVRWADA